jgi:hypothetical protein
MAVLPLVLRGSLPRIARVWCRTAHRGQVLLTEEQQGFVNIGATGFEPATSWSRTNGKPNASLAGKEVTQPIPSGCTSGCTSEAKTDNAVTVEALAAALQALSAVDRARLAALLMGEQPEGTGR